MTAVGGARRLYILPLDHRESVTGELFRWREPLDEAQTAAVAAAKAVIYDGFKRAFAAGAGGVIAASESAAMVVSFVAIGRQRPVACPAARKCSTWRSPTLSTSGC